MMKKVIATPEAPAAIGPYSQGIAASGTFIYTSGQIPLTPEGNLLEGSIEDKTRLCFRHLEAILKQEGAALSDVVKFTVFVKDIQDFAAINGVFEEVLAGTEPPARSLVQAAALPKGVSIEIDAVAVKPA
jgi:2-iminobutanoate/2-iminopropanoate deaminase